MKVRVHHSFIICFMIVLIAAISLFMFLPASVFGAKSNRDLPDKGKQRIVLKQNVINGINTITQSMMPPVSGKNTIYVITHDYVLGEDITIPNDCILEFDGGSITSGSPNRKTIKGQNTHIDAGLFNIFNDIKLVGTWKVEFGYPEWFGARGNGNHDDTDAFYSALSNFDSIFLNGKYSIDFKDIDLVNKTIVGKWRTTSEIIQRNQDVPFALVKQYNYLNRFTFRVNNNSKVTDVLHFGYSKGTYNSFSFTDLTNIVFVSNDKTIPLHFNIRDGGNSDCLVENVRIYHCYMGVWYEFHKTNDKTFGWITQCTMKDVTIHNPSSYGFKWDALSMYDQGKVVNGKKVQTMWCYNNYFENIGVDITQDKATGFYIGQGMGMLVNPMVFNDIPATQPDAVGYSVEFAPTGSPLRQKMVTNIIGGSFEGQVKNMEYAYMNNISNLKISLRDNRGSTDRYVTLDSSSIPDAYDFNIFGNTFLNQFTLKNAKLDVGADEFGEYIKIIRIDPEKEFYFGGGPSKENLINYGVKNGVYTLQAVAESNLGGKSSGFYFQNSKLRFSIEGNSGENMVEGKDGTRICNSVFLDINDNIIQDLSFGYKGTANNDLRWVKIYSIRLLRGIIGKYNMEKPNSPRKETIRISRTFKVGDGSLSCSATFSSIIDLSNGNTPLSIQCEGSIPSGSVGTVITLGRIQSYYVARKIIFPVYNSDSDAVVGMCSVDKDGTFKFHYKNKIDTMLNVYGSA